LEQLNFEEKEGKVSYQYGKDSLKREKMDYGVVILEEGK